MHNSILLASLLICSLFSFRCGFLSSEDSLDELTVYEQLNISSVDELTQRKVLDINQVAKSYPASQLVSLDGPYYSGMPFRLYGIGRIKHDEQEFILVRKEVDLVDGRLLEIYLVDHFLKQAANTNQLVARYEDMANCGTSSTIDLKNGLLQSKIIQSCYTPDSETEADGNWEQKISVRLDLNSTPPSIKRDTVESFREL